jgi:hypothetical protein
VVFKALIRLEANRRENNEQIVVVCYNMVWFVRLGLTCFP